MTDSELIAAASLLFSQSAQAMADNELCKMRGDSPSTYPSAILQNEIEEELMRRKNENL